jgi:hypothetical protein
VQVLPPLDEDPDATDFRLATEQSYAWCGLEDDERYIVIRGEMVLAQRRRRGFADWLQIGEAIEVLQREVIRQSGATNNMGSRYNRAWRELAPPQLQRLSQSCGVAMGQ